MVSTPRTLLALVLAGALAITSCASSESPADESSSRAATAETAAEASQPDPTAVPTAAPEPTAVPAPTVASEPVSESGESTDRFDEITAIVDAFVADRGLNGAGLVVVDQQDGVVYSEHFGEFDADRVSLIASSSKMVSAGVLLKLQEQGLLDINAPLSEYVDWPDVPTGMTAAQLISNSSGLVGLGPDLLYTPYICQWVPAQELEDCGQGVLTGTGDDADVIAPDTQFRYGGAQWQVAGAIAEAVSGRTWAELITEIYVEPCGVDSLGYINLGSVITTGGFGYPTSFEGSPENFPTENPNIEGGGYVTTGDYATLLLMHLQGGMCGETQVLSQESLDVMHADRIDAAYGGDADGFGYGMGWWINRETGRITDEGAFGTVPWLDLDDGYGAYLVVEDTSATGQELFGEIEDLVHAAVTS